MGLFRPYNRDEKTVADESSATPNQSGSKKNRPTPTRAEAEAARMQRLNPVPSKKELRARQREVREQERIKNYQTLESQPERVLLRNFVDSRWTFSEFVMPLMLIVFAASLLGARIYLLLQISTWLMYGLLVGMVLEVTWLWFRYKQILFERYPHANKRGLLAYMWSRMIQPRRFRRPGTQINRGDPF